MNNIGTKMNGKEATSKSLKPGSHLPKKNYFFFVCFNDSSSKMMKNAFISS